jgi:hypothetical protein
MARACLTVGKQSLQWDKRDCIYTTSIEDVSRNQSGTAPEYARSMCKLVALHARDNWMNCQTKSVQ